MKSKLYLKLLIAALPALVIVSIYIINDPFKVIYHYNSFVGKDGKNYVTLNKDYTGTEMYISNKEKYAYDSYVFGSSRCRYYRVDKLKKYIDGKSFYHFDAYLEGLSGVAQKVNFIHAKGMHIKNALLVFDIDLFKSLENPKGHIYRKHPLTSGESISDFQIINFKDFLDVTFLSAYLKFLATGKISNESIANGIMDTATVIHNVQTNEEDFTLIENMINADPEKYYAGQKDLSAKRDTIERMEVSVILAEQKKLLFGIKKVLNEDNTNYKVVISPLFDQKRLNTQDMAFLDSLFGHGKVYNFSGKNKLTDDVHNYYEKSHYRLSVADYIIDSIYGKKEMETGR